MVEPTHLNMFSSTINTNQCRLYDVYLNELPYNTNTETLLFVDNNLSYLDNLYSMMFINTSSHQHLTILNKPLHILNLIIEDYLTLRQQRVTLEGFTSTFQMLDAGVPQGSVLGPFLFLLYINDITNGISNNIRLFADDTSLFAIINDDVIQQTLSITNDLDIIKN